MTVICSGAKYKLRNEVKEAQKAAWTRRITRPGDYSSIMMDFESVCTVEGSAERIT